MKTSKFLILSAAVKKAMDGMSKIGKTSPEKAKELSRTALMTNLPEITEALNDLLLNPTKEDIALLSMQTSAAASLYLLLLSTPEEKHDKEPVVKELQKTIQRYLKLKASGLNKKDKEELIEMIDENMPAE